MPNLTAADLPAETEPLAQEAGRLTTELVQLRDFAGQTMSAGCHSTPLTVPRSNSSEGMILAFRDEIAVDLSPFEPTQRSTGDKRFRLRQERNPSQPRSGLNWMSIANKAGNWCRKSPSTE
jgi:hypothetical protein